MVSPQTVKGQDPVVDGPDAPQSVQDIPMRKTVERGTGGRLVGTEKLVGRVAPGMEGEDMAEECHSRLPGLDGDVGPVHDPGQSPSSNSRFPGL